MRAFVRQRAHGRDSRPQARFIPFPSGRFKIEPLVALAARAIADSLDHTQDAEQLQRPRRLGKGRAPFCAILTINSHDWNLFFERGGSSRDNSSNANPMGRPGERPSSK